MITLVILLSTRKSRREKEIVKILQKYGADYISDKILSAKNGKFIVIGIYKKTEIAIDKGIVIFVEKNPRFIDQKFPIGLVGVCEENNNTALQTLKKSKNAVISFGINNKNTITLSSITEDTLLATLQRSIYDISGNLLEPCELKIKLTEKFSPFAVMSAVAILLYNGIIPKEF